MLIYILLDTSVYYIVCFFVSLFFLLILSHLCDLSKLSALTSLQFPKKKTLTSLPPRRRPTRSSTSPTHALDPLCRTKPLTHSIDPRRRPILKSLLWPCRHRPTTKSSSSLQLVSLLKSHSNHLTSRLPRFWVGIVDESESLWVCDINKRNIRNKH